MNTAVLFSILNNLLLANKKQQISKLKNDQTKLTMGGESPLPGGFEKGVGKKFPEIPLIKCGRVLARKTPASNANK